VAKEVSERGCGLLRVEAMALQHKGVVEVACNLLDYQLSGPQQVEAAVRAAAAARGVGTGSAYCIGKLPEEMVALAAAGAF
jgi:glutamate formiminotransferase